MIGKCPEDAAAVAGFASRSSRFGASLPLFFGAIAYLSTLGWGPRALSDPDTYWHIAVGRWILAHHAVPHHGIFSGPMAQAPWVAHEWLAELVIAGLYDRWGWGGLGVATALCGAAAVALLLRLLLRWLEPVHAMIATALGWDLAFFHMLARPHVFALPLLVLWVGALAVARARERAPSLRLVPLMVLWANLHASWVVGVGLAGLLAGEAVILAPGGRARRGAAAGWALFVAAALVAALLTPFGPGGLLLPFRLTGMSFAMQLVLEWRSPNFQHFHPLELWLALVYIGALSFGFRLAWPRAVIVFVLLHLTLQHQRYIDVLGLVTPILMAPALGAQIRARFGARPQSGLDRAAAELAKPASPAGVAAGAAALIVATALLLRVGIAPRSKAYSPSAALAAVAAQHISGPVLNSYDFGGYLIFRGIAPMIDGRNELYGDAFIKRYSEAIQLIGEDLPRLLDQYHVAWTLLEPKTPAIALLDHLPGWRRLYADDIAVVHVRARPSAR